MIYYGKTMVLLGKKTMVVWKKLWYYGKIYDTIPKTMELWFTMEKNYGTMEKTYGTILKYMKLKWPIVY